MRSSKSRSRSKQNRPRTLGNIINRVFDSSGPEGKVRGTPQQIIEKYQMLARDAQLSNDRVAAENFLQHAEHYTRLLAEAQREMAAEQEARQQQFQQNGGNQNGGNPNPGQNGNREREFRDRDRGEYRERDYRDRDDRDFRDPGSDDQPVVEVIDLSTGESGLVETPEARRRDPAPEPVDADGQPRRDRRDDRPQGERRDRRDRDFRRDREERRRDPADAPAAELPSFITGPVPEPKAEPKAEPKPEPKAAPQPAPKSDAEAKPRRAPRKPKPEGAAEKDASE